jgi:hypothetical protein
MEWDVKWFIKTCAICQKRQTDILKAPLSSSHVPSIFEVLHMDTMEMTPRSNQCKYILHARCALSQWPEAKAVRRQTGESVGSFAMDVFMRFCCCRRMIVDNGTPFKNALNWLRRVYGIDGITISAYNSKANASIEKPHYNLRETISRATIDKLDNWFWYLPYCVWADRISIRKRTGVSPYFMVTGAHPITPLDLIEATWLVDWPTRVLTTGEMIALRARALIKHKDDVARMRQKITIERAKALLKFAEDWKHYMKNFKFKYGDPVLIRDSEMKNSLSGKMYNNWFGPCIVLRKTDGGSYICAQQNGATIGERISKDRLLPYRLRDNSKWRIPPNLEDWVDISRQSLRELSAHPITRNWSDHSDLGKSIKLFGQK